jgi:hypothetical protein
MEVANDESQAEKPAMEPPLEAASDERQTQNTQNPAAEQSSDEDLRENVATDVPSEVSTDEEEDAPVGDAVVNQNVKPVFFNVAGLRLMKIFLGASLCAMMLNIPHVERVPTASMDTSAAKASVVFDESEPDSLIVKIAMAAGHEIEHAAEGLAEKVTAIIEPIDELLGIPLVRRKSKSLEENRSQASSQKEMPEYASDDKVVAAATEATAKNDKHLAQSESEAKINPRIVRTAMNRDHTALPIVEEVEPKAVQEDTDAYGLAWRSANILPHITFAVVIIVGFAVQAAHVIAGLVQSLPGFVRKIRA